MVVDSIDGTANFHDLAARLWDLNRQGMLRRPLVGDLGATVYIYKANEDENDIKQSFRATLLPPPMNEAEAPTGFGISLEDLLGGRVPNNHDPKDVIWFSFKRLETVPDFLSNVNSFKIIEYPERGRALPYHPICFSILQSISALNYDQ